MRLIQNRKKQEATESTETKDSSQKKPQKKATEEKSPKEKPPKARDSNGKSPKEKPLKARDSNGKSPKEKPPKARLPKEKNPKARITNEKGTEEKPPEAKDTEENPAQGAEIYRNIYDRIFKRLFSLSDKAIIGLINGLFGESFPADSSVECRNTEFVRADLRGRQADNIVTVAHIRTFHTEAQLRAGSRVSLRLFEYGLLFAMGTQPQEDALEFPEPAVIYLDRKRGLPEESTLHASFGIQGSFDYKVKNFMYLAHSVDELDRKNMALLLPFQLLHLRRALENWLRAKRKAQKQEEQEEAQKREEQEEAQKQGKAPEQEEQEGPPGQGHQGSSTQKSAPKRYRIPPPEKIQRLQEEIAHDIIGSINKNLEAGSITEDDATQLLELSNLLHEHIYEEFKKKGGGIELKPLLSGAIELPNDKYRLRIIQLEEENIHYKEENTHYKKENIQLEDKLSISENKIAHYK